MAIYIYINKYIYIYDEDEHVKVLVRVLQFRLCCSAWKDFFACMEDRAM